MRQDNRRRRVSRAAARGGLVVCSLGNDRQVTACVGLGWFDDDDDGNREVAI